HDLVDEATELLGVEGQAFGGDVVRDHPVDLMPQLRAWDLLDVREVELVDELAVHPYLRIHQLGRLQEPSTRGLIAVLCGGNGSRGCRPVNLRRVPLRAMGW